MPDPSSALASKMTTAEEAISLIRPGRRILIGSGAAEPLTLVDALVEHGHHLSDSEIVHILTLGPAPYVRPEHASRFRHTAFFIGPNVREAVQEGRADFVPVFLSELPRLISSRRIRIDVALIQTTLPDEHGYVSLGVSVDVVRAAVEAADLVLCELNPNMPRTHGDSFLHVSRIHRFVSVATPLPTLHNKAPSEVDHEIGRHVATLVPNGATIQTGIGTLPDAILSALCHHHDLGIHTEMLSDGIMSLVQAGVINGAKKTRRRGKLVTSFVMGSQALYDWVHDNPAVEMRSTEFTNDPRMIAQNDRMVSINSALGCDLTGQVAADTLFGKFFSGIGGQVDFVRGAAGAREGRSIIALRSTARKGQVSRIRAALEEGAGVVTSRGDVRYIVTEYGIADLWGRSVRERALSLIEIAHPDHRSELLGRAKERRFVFPDQVVPKALYPWQELRRERLKDGREVTIRPIRLSDEESLQRLFYELSSESVYRRFMAHKSVHTHEEMQLLADSDYESNMGLVVCEPEHGNIIAMARYDVDPSTGFGDIAFVVHDGWQRQGLATLLLRRMAAIARARGLKGFTADVLSTNTPMLMVFQHSGLPVTSQYDGGSYHLTIALEPLPPHTEAPVLATTK